jgi:hypothetical protein
MPLGRILPLLFLPSHVFLWMPGLSEPEKTVATSLPERV